MTMMNFSIRKNRKAALAFSLLSLAASFFNPFPSQADDDLQIKERKQFDKSIRTRMPPQLLIENIQAMFKSRDQEWNTSWQAFIVEDDPAKDEFVIVARSYPKPWAFGLTNEKCPPPENFEDLQADIKSGGTPVPLNVLIGVKKKKSWFRYVINVYDPMYTHWKNPCYAWNLAPGKSSDPFYKENYSMEVYASNMKKKVHNLVSTLSTWKPPKKIKRIPVMMGPGQEIIGGDADELLTDEERKLPLKEQEKLLKERAKMKKKEDKDSEKKR